MPRAWPSATTSAASRRVCFAGEPDRPVPADDLDGAEHTHLRFPHQHILTRWPARANQGYTEAKPRSATVIAMSYAVVEDVAASWESYERFAAPISSAERPRG